MKWASRITENLGVKLAALVFAIALYLHVVTERPTEQVLAFPMHLEGLPDSIALAMPAPDEVSALVRGTGKQIILLRVLRPPVSLNLAGVEAGNYQRALTVADFQKVGAEGVEVVRPVVPSTIDLKLERRLSTRVPVAVRVRGEPPRGYGLAGSPTAHPPQVRLSGPASWVRAQDTLYTEPISLSGRRGNVAIIHPLAELPPWATAAPGSVFVRMTIDEEASGEVTLTPEIRGARDGFRVRLDPATVRVRWASPKDKAADATRNLEAQVDLERRGRGRYARPVRVSGGGAGVVRAVLPESVAVVVQ
jgi:hypothetical protein